MTQRAAVYRHLNAAGETLYIGCSANPFQRFTTHMSQSSWLTDVVEMKVQWFGSKAAAYKEEARLIREERPPHNRQLNGRPSVWVETPGPAILQKWMDGSGASIRDVARALGITTAFAGKLLLPTASPRAAKRFAISAFTSGGVPSTCWYRRAESPDPDPQNAVDARKWLERNGFPVPAPFPTPTQVAA